MTNNVSYIISRALLDAGAFMIRPSSPFLLTSGLVAPFYINCRKILGNVEARTEIADAISRDIVKYKPDVIAGGVTAGVPFATMVADRLKLPMAYIRPLPKEHGTGSQIEGTQVSGSKVLLVEDLITTAKSIGHFIQALRGEGAEVSNVSVIFSRMTETAEIKLNKLDVSLSILCDLDTLLDVAKEEGKASQMEIEEVVAFLKCPEKWSANNSK